jgi:hypothetical protein
MRRSIYACHSRYNGIHREAIVHTQGVVALIIEPKSNAATYVDTFELGNPRYMMQGNGGDVGGTLIDRNIMAPSF